MFGGYDPSYNPENLEKKKAEAKELDPQQAAVANKWSEAMADTETTAETPAEAEPTIPETEPQLQANLEEDMATADELPTEDTATGDELPTEDTTAEQPKESLVGDAIAEGAKVAVDAAASNPIESHVANAAIDAAKDAIEDHLNENKAEEGTPATAATTPEAGSIQHFSPEANTASSFAPLSPEEQRSNKVAAEEAHGKTYTDPEEAINAHVVDEDNLVARAVGQNMGEGSIDLNAVGQKLEAVPISKAKSITSKLTSPKISPLLAP